MSRTPCERLTKTLPFGLGSPSPKVVTVVSGAVDDGEGFVDARELDGLLAVDIADARQFVAEIALAPAEVDGGEQGEGQGGGEERRPPEAALLARRPMPGCGAATAAKAPPAAPSRPEARRLPAPA